MCRYRYYSAHKTPQPHLKMVSCWNTLAASKLGSRLRRQHRPGPPSAQHIPLRWGMAENLLLLHKPVPVIKTLYGSPLKGSGYFCHGWYFFKRGIWFAWDDYKMIRLMCSDEALNLPRLNTETPFVLLLYVTEKEGEDETRLKEASVLISSEGSLLFFPHPFFSWARPLQKLTWPCVPCNMFT